MRRKRYRRPFNRIFSSKKLLSFFSYISHYTKLLVTRYVEFPNSQTLSSNFIRINLWPNFTTIYHAHWLNKGEEYFPRGGLTGWKGGDLWYLRTNSKSWKFLPKIRTHSCPPPYMSNPVSIHWVYFERDWAGASIDFLFMEYNLTNIIAALRRR